MKYSFDFDENHFWVRLSDFESKNDVDKFLTVFESFDNLFDNAPRDDQYLDDGTFLAMYSFEGITFLNGNKLDQFGLTLSVRHSHMRMSGYS